MDASESDPADWRGMSAAELPSNFAVACPVQIPPHLRRAVENWNAQFGGYDWFHRGIPKELLPLGLGVGWPASRNRQAKGSGDGYAWTEQAYESARESSRILYLENDFAGALINRMVDYTVGKGFDWQACLRGVRKGAPVLGQDDDTPPAVKQLQRVFDEFRDRNRWWSVQQETWRRALRDGEAFRRVWGRGGGRLPAFRWVEPECVGCPPMCAGDPRWTYGVLAEEDDDQCVLGFWAHRLNDKAAGQMVRAEGADEGRFLAAAEQYNLPACRRSTIVHVKYGVDASVKRGLPLLFSSESMLRAARLLLRNVLETAAYQAGIALIATHAGATPAQLTDFAALLRNAGLGSGGVPGNPGVVNGGVVFTNPTEIPTAGSRRLDVNEHTTYAPGPVSTGTAAFLSAEQAAIYSAAARVGMPGFMILSSTEQEANRAAVREAGSPFVTARETDQRILADDERALARELVRLACDAGLVDADPDELDCEVTPPPVAMRDELEQEQIRNLQIQNRTLSEVEAIQQEGRDPKHVIANIKAFRAALPDAGAQGPGGPAGAPADPNAPTPDPAQPGVYVGPRGGQGVRDPVTGKVRYGAGEGRRVAEVRDDSGHEHKGKGPGGGQFTSGGGGGSGSEPKSPAGKKPKATAARVPEKPTSDRAARAKAAHKLIDKTVQRYAEEHNEPQFAQAVGGLSFKDNEPVDVVVGDASGRIAHGIELKTMVDNANNKITMKREAMERKARWSRANKATFHTVVIDDSAVFNAKGEGRHDESKRRLFYRRGFGSFRVGGMYEVKGGVEELKRLLDTPKRNLPAGAV